MQSQARVPYPGVLFDYGEAPLIVPAITVTQAEKLASDIDTAQEPFTAETRDAITVDAAAYKVFKTSLRERQAAMRRVIAVALRRNYPDITDDTIDNFVDVDNVAVVFNAAMGLSTLPKVRSSTNGHPPTSGVGAISTGGESEQG